MKKKRENEYQAGLIKRIEKRFPGSMVLKNDARYLQGVPDLIVLHDKNWATLEVKREPDAHRQPNQSYYVAKMNRMSFSRVIDPENEREVLDDMEQAFSLRRSTRVSKRKQA